MARKWQPKYKMICKCGWTGKRTRRMNIKPCPKCGRRVREVDRK